MQGTRRRTVLTAAAGVLSASVVMNAIAPGRADAGIAAGAGAAGTEPGDEPTKPDPPEEPTPEFPPPVFPRPGGGPRAIHSFVHLTGTRTYLLDTSTGSYVQVPFENVLVSPDERSVMVDSFENGFGIAHREALLRAGETAVRWIELPPGSPGGWSPDGKALLSTTLNKDTRQFIAHRYDIATRRVLSTPIPLDTEVGTAGWAADSIRYVVMVAGPDPAVPSGPMWYLNPNGRPGPMVGTDGMVLTGAYSPSRRYVIVEPPRPFDAAEPTGWQLPKVFDLSARRVVATIPTGWPVVGWYDGHRVVNVALNEPDTVLEIRDIYSGGVTRQVPAPGLPPALIGLGSSARLHGAAGQLGF